MTNIAKYLLLLESLQFQSDESSESVADHTTLENQRLEQNVQTFTKYIKDDLTEVRHKLLTTLEIIHLEKDLAKSLTTVELEATYALYMQHVLLEIANNTNFNSDAKEDLISTRHTNLCIEGIQDLSHYALSSKLHPTFYGATSIFGKPTEIGHNYAQLLLSVHVIDKLLQIKQFHIANSLELVLRDYMAAIFTLFLAHELKEYHLQEQDLKQLQAKLNSIWQHITKVEYFRNIMLLKAMRQLPVQLQKRLHQELLQKLLSKDGFTTLVATLQLAKSGGADAHSNDKQTFEIVANIAANKGFSRQAQNTLIKQIFKFFTLCLQNQAMLESMGAGLLTLRRLYDLNVDNQVLIRETLKCSMNKLIEPEDLLTGLMLMDYKEFAELISLWYQLYCISTVECLPSAELTDYLPLFLQLYYNLPAGFVEKQQLASLLTRCLNNREPPELQQIIEQLYTLNYPTTWHSLHPRILVLPNPTLNLKIAASDYKQDFSISLALPELLMSAQHNQLTYRIFMLLLRQMFNLLEKDAVTPAETAIELLQSEEELITFLNSKYPLKVEIVLSLNTLISHQPLKAQISEHAKEFLNFLRSLIEQRVAHASKASEYTDQTLLIMLTLAQEMLENSQLPEMFRDFLPTLALLQKQRTNQLIQQRLSSLITLLSGELKTNATQGDSAFAQARLLIETQESHLQVYGIQMLLDLLRKRDDSTMANVHVIIALALSTLRHRESYTFLNCVRLFVALVNVMEAEVLEVLSDEYLNDKTDMDFRLVVGEAILKVGQELGPLCYKHKDVLLNCFMHGARSPLDEFRMSAFANLAQMTRILSYQVHNFFQELLTLIECELNTGKYLPAKRAAVLVLSELLEGMDNLLDFEEMLLPIYRLLKTLEAAEDVDPKMRLHAANGLKALSAKCKKLLFPAQQLHKEIRVLGINDKPKDKRSSHILELN